MLSLLYNDVPSCSIEERSGDLEGQGAAVTQWLKYQIMACIYEFEPSTTIVPPFRGAMHVKSVQNSNVLPLV
ncbi:hypothetical protein TNCV_5064331 [Trichonephila clavipes]|nr:hypothetical protein TNCV_5064331 [Trichonephila clavipes]